MLTYGPMGLICGWLMVRAEKKFDLVIAHLGRLSHRIDGLTRAMLADVLSRDSTGDVARKIAQEMLDKMDEADADDRKAQDPTKP